MAYYLEFDGAGRVDNVSFNRDYVGDGTSWDFEFRAANTTSTEFAVVGKGQPTGFIILRNDNTIDFLTSSNSFPVSDITDHSAVYRFEFRILAGNDRKLTLYENDNFILTRTISDSAVTATQLGYAVAARPGALYYISYTDHNNSNNNRFYDPSASNGTGSILPDTVGGNDGTLVNFPTDDSQWVFYYDGSEPEPVAQPVSLITAEVKNEALTLPISEALSVNLLTGEHVTNSYVLNLVSSQVGNATISEERHQSSMLTVEQTASQSVISIAADHRSEAQILTPIQQQRLNSIVAQQVEQALSASLSSIQALTFVVAEEIQYAAPLTVEQYTGQLITLIVAEQREGTQTLLVSEVNKLDLVTAEQASYAQALSIKDLQKIKTIEVEQLTEAEILYVLLSGDNTDLTGLRLQPVTPIYSITPIANSYSLNKV